MTVPNKIEHEWWLTHFLTHFTHWQWQRSSDLPRKADAIVRMPTRNNEQWLYAYAEMDTGATTLAQVRGRWERAYSDSDQLVLVICRTEQRMKNVMAVSEVLGDKGMFVNMESVSRNPSGNIVFDLDGVNYAFPKAFPKKTDVTVN